MCPLFEAILTAWHRTSGCTHHSRLLQHAPEVLKAVQRIAEGGIWQKDAKGCFLGKVSGRSVEYDKRSDLCFYLLSGLPSSKRHINVTNFASKCTKTRFRHLAGPDSRPNLRIGLNSAIQHWPITEICPHKVRVQTQPHQKCSMRLQLLD